MEVYCIFLFIFLSLVISIILHIARPLNPTLPLDPLTRSKKLTAGTSPASIVAPVTAGTSPASIAAPLTAGTSTASIPTPLTAGTSTAAIATPPTAGTSTTSIATPPTSGTSTASIATPPTAGTSTALTGPAQPVKTVKWELMDEADKHSASSAAKTEMSGPVKQIMWADPIDDAGTGSIETANNIPVLKRRLTGGLKQRIVRFGRKIRQCASCSCF